MAQPTPQKALNDISSLARLMDSQFKVPGTNWRFGLDAIIGLIPGVGDLSTFAVSGYMLWMMANNGASGYVMARMVINVLIDALIGSIPLIGDLFDFYYKANMRNLRLMEEHYRHGRHRGGAWKAIVPVLIILLLVVVGIIWVMYQLMAALYHLIF